MAAVLNQGPVLALLAARGQINKGVPSVIAPSVSHAVPGSAEYGIADIPR